MGRTPRTTRREDWLTDALAEAGFFVSNSPITARRSGVTDGLVGLRFAGHFPPEMYLEGRRFPGLPSHYDLRQGFLSVELPSQEVVDSFAPDDRLRSLHRYFRRLFTTPIAIIAYARGTSIGPRLWVLDDYTAERHEGPIASREYAERINRRRNPLLGDDPQVKGINQTMNDAFQAWTRTYLSPQFSINDLDALSTQINPIPLVMLELKRSNIPVNEWRPYLNDAPNFQLLKACVRDHRDRAALDATVHYPLNPGDPYPAGLHIISAVSNAGITGWAKHLSAASPGELVEQLRAALAGQVDRAYTSTNRLRQS